MSPCLVFDGARLLRGNDFSKSWTESYEAKPVFSETSVYWRPWRCGVSNGNPPCGFSIRWLPALDALWMHWLTCCTLPITVRKCNLGLKDVRGGKEWSDHRVVFHLHCQQRLYNKEAIQKLAQACISDIIPTWLSCVSVLFGSKQCFITNICI